MKYHKELRPIIQTLNIDLERWLFCVHEEQCRRFSSWCAHVIDQLLNVCVNNALHGILIDTWILIGIDFYLSRYNLLREYQTQAVRIQQFAQIVLHCI